MLGRRSLHPPSGKNGRGAYSVNVPHAVYFLGFWLNVMFYILA
jgi:hypothetical protein